MRNALVLFAIALFMSMPVVTNAEENRPLFHKTLAEKPPTPDPMIVVVWLVDGTDVVNSRTICFEEEFLLTRMEDDLLMLTSSAGAIGIKEVVDALRLLPDEQLDDIPFSRPQVGSFDFPVSQYLQIVWEPNNPSLAFYLEDFPPGEQGNCEMQPQFPDKSAKPELIMRGDVTLCENIRLERPVNVQGTSTMLVTVPADCQ